MKRAFRPLIILSALVVLFSHVQALAETIYIEGKVGRLRQGPGTGYQVLWEAKRFTPLEYLAKYKDWYVVRDHEGDVGWLHKQVVGKGKAAIVIKSKANIRKGPAVKHPKVFEVEKGYLFKVLEEKSGWYKVVDIDGDKGWVSGSLLWVSK